MKPPSKYPTGIADCTNGWIAQLLTYLFTRSLSDCNLQEREYDVAFSVDSCGTKVEWQWHAVTATVVAATVICYRAMHFSANAPSWDRMSSVCPSVCDVGGL